MKLERLTKAQIAARFLVDVRTITNWLKAGMPVRREDGETVFVWADCYRWREARIREDARSTRHADGDEERRSRMADAKVREAIAAAEDAELELSAKKGRYLPIDYVRSEFERIGLALRAKLLGLPPAWATRIGTATTAIDRQLMLEAAINEAMPALRDLVDAQNTVVGIVRAVRKAKLR